MQNLLMISRFGKLEYNVNDFIHWMYFLSKTRCQNDNTLTIDAAILSNTYIMFKDIAILLEKSDSSCENDITKIDEYLTKLYMLLLNHQNTKY